MQKILAHNGRKIVYVTTDKSYAIKIAPPTAQGQEYYTTCAIIGAQVIAALPANAVNGIFQVADELENPYDISCLNPTCGGMVLPRSTLQLTTWMANIVVHATHPHYTL